MTDTNWRDEANCATTDPDIFIPEVGGNTEYAKSICLACPVREMCLQWAVDNFERGIWGGTSDRERRKIRQERTPTHKGNPNASLAAKQYADGMSATELAEMYGTTRQTIYRWVNKAKEAAA